MFEELGQVKHTGQFVVSGGSGQTKHSGTLRTERIGHSGKVSGLKEGIGVLGHVGISGQ